MNMQIPARYQSLPPVVRNIIIICSVVWLADIVLGTAANIDLGHYLGLHYWRSPFFKPWQLVTHLFMHGNFMHLFTNMLGLWMFGSIIENRWGSQRFLLFYFICGLGAALCHMATLAMDMEPVYAQIRSLPPSELAQMNLNPFYMMTTVGASGAIMGILFAFGYLYPDVLIYFYFLIPIKAKYFVALYAAFELYSGIQNSAGDNIAHFAHLGGMLFAFILLKIWRIRYGGPRIQRWQ